MKRTLLPIFVGNILLWSTTTFFIPLTIFLTNRVEFPSTLAAILVQITIPTVICTVVFSSLLFLVSAKKQSLIVSILITLSILVWIQSNLIVVNAGVLDGQEINWHQYSVYGLIDFTLWIAFLVLAIKFNKLISKHIFSIAGLLITIQLLSTTVNFIYSPADLEFKNYIIDEANKFTFSQKKNVIVIVLDTFQTNYFANALKDHPEYISQLAGFTYFPNATAGFNTTYPSIPLILTGQYYDNAKPIQEFITDTFKKSSLPQFLKAHNFQNDFYPLLNQTIALTPVLVDNLKSWRTTSYLIDPQKITALGYLTWFRALPQYLKPAISEVGFAATSMSYQQPQYEMINFLKSLNSDIKVSNIQEQFKFYHLRGLHPPLTTNEVLAYENMPFTPHNYARAALGSLEMIKEFVNTLKSANVYDQSMIVILGDHGAGLPIDVESTEEMVPESVRSRGQPLVLVKPFQNNLPLNIANTAVSLEDVYKTVATKIDSQATVDIPGKDIFQDNISADRTRQYFFYEWGTGIWNTSQSFLPPMRKYIISGDSWDPASWHDTREIYQNGKVSFFENNYVLGTEIDFSKKNVSKYQVSGWSDSEKDGTWTIGKQAVLELSQLPQNKDMILNFDLTPFKEQQVTLSLNNHPIGIINVGKKAHYKVMIPSQFVKGTQDIIKFNISSPISPLELGVSADERQLGVFVGTMSISELPQYTIGEQINFTTQDFNADQWIDSGWSSPEADGTWTLGTTADLFLNKTDTSVGNLLLKATITPLTHGPKLTQQSVKISVNNQAIGEWQVNKSGEYTLPIPASVLISPTLHIVFSIPNAATPASLGSSADTRQLGILFKTMLITSQ